MALLEVIEGRLVHAGNQPIQCRLVAGACRPGGLLDQPDRTVEAGLTGLLAAALDWRDGHAKQRLEVIDARHGRSMPPRTSGLPRHSRHRAPMPAGQTRPQPVITATSRTHDHAGTRGQQRSKKRSSAHSKPARSSARPSRHCSRLWSNYRTTRLEEINKDCGSLPDAADPTKADNGHAEAAKGLLPEVAEQSGPPVVERVGGGRPRGSRAEAQEVPRLRRSRSARRPPVAARRWRPRAS